jgi:hypothetical protein
LPLSIGFSMNRQGEQQSPDFEVTAEVRNFYERYPYPPPVESLDMYQWHWQDRLRRRADYHLFWPAGPFSGRVLHSGRWLRYIPGGKACLALARGAGDGHRL